MNGSYAHLLPATVILGGAGTLAITASGEISDPGAQVASVLAGLAIWGFLALLWVLNVRAARYQAWALRTARRGPPKAPRGAFWKGAGVGLLMTISALLGAAYLLAHGSPGVQALAGWALLVGGGWGLLVVPLVAGWVWAQIAATRIPPAP